MIARQLSPHFSLAEFIVTETGLDNTPPPEMERELYAQAWYMEGVRCILGNRPMRVHSCYRGEAVNLRVRGVKTSAHCHGMATDFDVPGIDNFQAARLIAASGLPYDQLILEYGWVHIARGPGTRQQCLTKKSAKSGYLQGLVK